MKYKKNILLIFLISCSFTTIAQSVHTDKNFDKNPISKPFKACVEKKTLPRKWGPENPPNRHWPRALMGSHKPSPFALAEAEKECESPFKNQNKIQNKK